MDTLSTLGGFITGFGLTVGIVIYVWLKGKKENRFDERYETVHSKARALTLSILIILIFFLMIGAIMYEGMKLAAILLGVLYVVTLISYFTSVLLFNKTT